MLGKFKNYLKEVKGEMKRVSWSERKVLLTSTFLVIGLTLASAVYLGVVDILISRIIARILR